MIFTKKNLNKKEKYPLVILHDEQSCFLVRGIQSNDRRIAATWHSEKKKIKSLESSRKNPSWPKKIAHAKVSKIRFRYFVIFYVRFSKFSKYFFEVALIHVKVENIFTRNRKKKQLYESSRMHMKKKPKKIACARRIYAKIHQLHANKDWRKCGDREVQKELHKKRPRPTFSQNDKL